MTDLVELRGHHIPFLQTYYKQRNTSLQRNQDHLLKRHGYSRKTINHIYRLCEELCSQPNQKIVITNTLDDICDSCSKKGKDCTNLRFHDAYMAYTYGLTLGIPYTVQHVLLSTVKNDIL